MEDAPIGVSNISDYEKQQKKREAEEQKKIASLLKDHPNNTVLKSLSQDEKEEQREEMMNKNSTWDLVDDAYYAARHAFMEKDSDFKQIMSDLCEALEAIAQGYNPDDQEADDQDEDEMDDMKEMAMS